MPKKSKIETRAKYRTLVNGTKVKEALMVVKWSFESKCPNKWLHIDAECGHLYVSAANGNWKEPSDELLEAGIQALKFELSERKRISQ